MAKTKEKATEGQEITIKNETQHNFIIVYDSVYKNTELTTDEIALIIKLLAAAPTFKPTKRKLISILNISERALLKATKGLQEKGYLKIKKFGKTSEWTISQHPLKNLKDLKKESILDSMLNYNMTSADLDRLHKLKYIDDKEYIEILQDYTEEVKRRLSYNPYK